MNIYATEGFDETLVGTREQIMDHIKEQTGMHVSEGSHVIYVSDSSENQTDVDVFVDAVYTVTLTPATVLHEPTTVPHSIDGNDDVVGMGFSSAAYEHPKPLCIDDMVMGDLYTIKAPKYEFEHGFFEYVESDEKKEGFAFFIKVRTGEHYLLGLANVEKAGLALNIDGTDCHLELGEYEEVMEILKRVRGKS